MKPRRKKGLPEQQNEDAIREINMASNSNEGAFERPLIAFDGAISTCAVPHPGRVFAAEIEFDLDHPQLIKLASMRKPPLHFHPYKKEYIQVLEGRLCVEIDRVKRILTKEDGEIVVEPWEHHPLYQPPIDRNNRKRTVFILSGDDAPEVFKLDFVFFQNWYGYQDECVLGGSGFDLIQVLSMFDAGASYLSLPWWVSFGRTISRIMGIVAGRWIGGIRATSHFPASGPTTGTQPAPGWRSQPFSADSPTDPRPTRLMSIFSHAR